MARSCLFALIAVHAMALGAHKGSCVNDPLNMKLPRVEFENTPAIQILVAVSQTAKVCFGIEGASQLRNAVSVSDTGLTYREFVRRIAPEMRLQLVGNIVNLRPHTAWKGNWLDAELVLKTDAPQDVNGIAYCLLGTQLYYRSRPGLKDGIVGSIGSAGVNIGPYAKQMRPARALLNQLVRDAGGGCWLTPKLWLKRDGPPPMDPWLILLYRTDLKFNQRAVLTFGR